MRMKRADLAWILGAVLVTGGILFWFHRWATPYLNVETEGTVQVPPARAGEAAALVSAARLEATVRALAAEGSRLSGSAGADRTADRLKA